MTRHTTRVLAVSKSRRPFKSRAESKWYLKKTRPPEPGPQSLLGLFDSEEVPTSSQFSPRNFRSSETSSSAWLRCAAPSTKRSGRTRAAKGAWLAKSVNWGLARGELVLAPRRMLRCRPSLALGIECQLEDAAVGVQPPKEGPRVGGQDGRLPVLACGDEDEGGDLAQRTRDRVVELSGVHAGGPPARHEDLREGLAREPVA